MTKWIRFAAVLLLCLLLIVPLTSCADARMKKTIGTCAGYEVPYGELRYITMINRELMKNAYGEDIWTDPAKTAQYLPELESIIWDNLRNNYAVLALCAKYGLTKDDLYSDAIQDAVDQKIKEAIEQYGSKSAFRKAMKEQYMTEDFVRFALAVTQLENELLHVLTDDLSVIFPTVEPFVAWLEEGNYVRVQHVFIENDKDESIEENRALAESVRSQLLQGENIATFINSAINEDLYNTAPYYLVRDVYVEEMEDAAFRLHYVGDVSEVVETDRGFYVLVRIEDDRSALYSASLSLLESYQWAKLEEMVNETKNTLKVELNDYGKGLDLLKIK